MRVFLVEPHAGIRQRLVELLSDIPGFELSGEAGEVGTAIQGILECRPEVVVMNLKLEKGNGLDVMDAIRVLNPVPRIFLMTDFGDHDLASFCEQAGADYCLYEENRFEVLYGLLESLRTNRARDSEH